MKKYELLKDDTIQIGESTLYRVRALKDFSDVKAGDLGGYIGMEFNLSQEGNCWVYNNAKVRGNATVAGQSMLLGRTIICDESLII